MKSRAELGRLADVLGGLPVWGCLPNSAAAHAGLRYGDVLLAVNDTPTPSIDAYHATRAAAGTYMVMRIFRDGVELSIELRLEGAREGS